MGKFVGIFPLFVYAFSLLSNAFINMHEYANYYHSHINPCVNVLCLNFYLLPSLVVLNILQLAYR